VDDCVVVAADLKSLPDIHVLLRALNDDSFDRTIPERVPSGLKGGGN